MSAGVGCGLPAPLTDVPGRAQFLRHAPANGRGLTVFLTEMCSGSDKGSYVKHIVSVSQPSPVCRAQFLAQSAAQKADKEAFLSSVGEDAPFLSSASAPHPHLAAPGTSGTRPVL